MKPNFALSLSFEGIRLMHRSGTGWTIVGDVALDTSDMAGELAMLRKTALALDPAGLRTKLLLPNDQIKYLALDTTRATEDDVKAKLDGATPYAVADLVYDFVRGGGRTYIAAVARETLEEAEAFATEHRFGPVCFAGVPEEFTYVGEAFFGPTKASRKLLPAGETVERDAAPVKVPSKSARPAVLPVAAPKGPTDSPLPPAGDAVGPAVAAPVLPAAVAPSQVQTEQPAPPLPVTGVPILSATPARIIADVSPDTPEPVIAASGAGTATDPVVAAPVVAALADTPPPPTAASAAEPTPDAPHPDAPPPDAPAEMDETPVFASRARSHKGPKASGTTPSDLVSPVVPQAPAAAAPMPDTGLAATPATEPPLVRPAPVVAQVPPEKDPTAEAAIAVAATPVRAAEPALAAKPLGGLAVPVGRPVSAPPVAGTGRVTIDSVGLVPRGIIAGAAKPGVAPPVTGLSGAVRQNGSGTILPKSGSVIAPVVAKKPVLSDEAPFDDIPDLPGPATDARHARTAAPATKAANRPTRRKPRFLGLILTVVLVLVLFAVAAWATMTDTILSRWFGSQDEAVVTASAVSVPVAIPLSDDEALGTDAVISPEQDAPAQAAPVELTLAEPAPEPALTDPATVDTATAADPMPADGAENALADLPAGDLSNAVPPDAGAQAAAAAAVATAIAGLEATPDDPTGPAITAASPSLADPVLPEGGTVVTPEEAERFYAATGVWLRAPRLPLMPTAESLDGLYTAALDGSLNDRVATALQPLGADVGLVPQLNPPAPGTRFARDDRGFILATAEGTLTPDGMLVFAGQPSVVPPTRPGTVAPEVAPDAAPEAATEAATEVAPEALASDPAVPTVETVAQPVVPGTRPEARPDSFAALAAAADPPAEGETAATDPDLAETALPDAAPGADPATAGGVTLASLRPQGRPDDIAPPSTPEVDTVAFDGPRPAVRPDGLAPEGATSAPETEVPETALAETEAPADPVTEVSAALAAIVDGAADPLAGATAQAVAIASRPDARPTNFNRVVEQQTARLARAQPATETPAAASTAGDLSREEQAETEPEVASNAAAAPNGPIPGGVANAATFEDVMALREINLIGVYGQPSQRRALVRLANGRYLRVEVGDSLDGGQVAAISDSALNYVRRGRTITLEIPGE